jgi:hypothetical protein
MIDLLSSKVIIVDPLRSVSTKKEQNCLFVKSMSIGYLDIISQVLNIRVGLAGA